MAYTLSVLYEDDHIIVTEKPAGIPVQTGKITDNDMVSYVNKYLRTSAHVTGANASGTRGNVKSNNNPPSAYLIHRLDKPVRGILVFAKNKKAAAALNAQLTKGGFTKRYMALVEGRPEKDSDTLRDYMYKDSSQQKAFISHTDAESSQKQENPKQQESSKTAVPSSDIKLAELEYCVADDSLYSEYINDAVGDNTQGVCAHNAGIQYTMLDIHLITGRFHQIRCQLSNIGCPIAGDTLYGAATNLKNKKAIGLTAYSLEFTHPVTGKPMKFEIPV